MPRHCKTCGERHDPLTGKGCTSRNVTDSTTDTLKQVLHELSNITTHLDKLEQQNGDCSGLSGQQHTPADNAGSPQPSIDLGAHVRARMTDLNLLHDDTSGHETSDDEDKKNKATKRGKDKKLGHARTVDDIIVSEIDWPHYHVYRGNERRPAKYAEVTVQEFVFGYLISLEKTGP